MPIPFTCPHCQSPGRAPDGAGGLKLRCPRCRKLLLVPHEEAPSQQPIQVSVEAPERETSAIEAISSAIRVVFWLVAAALWIWLAVRVFLDQPRTVEELARSAVLFVAACFAFVIARCVAPSTRW